MFHLHVENRSTKSRVFQTTPELMSAALERGKRVRDLRWTIGSDLRDLSWLSSVRGLVTSNDVVMDPTFPRRRLAEAAPKLRWIHITGAGIEPLLPLTWLPDRVVLTNSSGVHAQKTGEFATMALLALQARLPQMATQQREARWQQVFTPSIAGRTALILGLGEM